MMHGAQEAVLLQELWLRPELKNCLDGYYELKSGGRGRFLSAALHKSPTAEEPAPPNSALPLR